jgi:hypothetical protein
MNAEQLEASVKHDRPQETAKQVDSTRTTRDSTLFLKKADVRSSELAH